MFLLFYLQCVCNNFLYNLLPFNNYSINSVRLFIQNKKFTFQHLYLLTFIYNFYPFYVLLSIIFIKEQQMNNFNTQDYDFLLKTLNQGSLIFKSQSLKRLLILAINDKKQFAPISKQLLYQIKDLYNQDKEDINLNVTLIVSQIVTSITSKQHEYLIMNNHIQSIIKNLGHITKPAVRKASHTFLLTFLRSYDDFNSLSKAYTQFGFNNQSPLIRQKAINSFQSILILELKKFEWKTDQSKDLFQNLLIKATDENSYVAKAAAQCLISMCKIQQIIEVAQRLSIGFLTKLKDFLQNAIQSLNATGLKILPQDIQNLMQGFQRPKRIQQIPIKVIQQQPVRKATRILQKQPQSPLIKLPSNNDTQRRLDKIRNSIRNENKKSSMIQKETTQSKLFGNVVLDGSIKQKTDAAEELLFKVQTNQDKPDFASAIKQILPSLVKMLKDSNPKIVGITLKILQLIIDQISPNDKNFTALLNVIVQKLGDAKISIRQSVGKVIKDLIRKTNKGIWIHELLQNMKKNTNTFLRDETLGLILNIFEENTKEEIDYDFKSLLDSIVIYSDDPKTKIKIRTLDCLAQIVLVSEEIQNFSQDLKSKMPTIFYQMFVQKVNKLKKEKDKLQQQIQRESALSPPKKMKEQFSTTSRTAYNEKSGTTYNHKRNQSQGDQNPKVNVSMQIVKRRVSLLKKPRNLMSTQQTTSVDNYSQKTIDRTLDNTIQDMEVVLPSLYKKTATNRFITRKINQSYSPNKTIDHKNQSSDYLSKEDLTPLKQPQRQFKEIMNQLKSGDWKVLFETTNRLRRILEFDPEIIMNSGQSTTHNVVMEVLTMVQSLRSSVSKNALLCLHQLIVLFQKQIDPEIELIFDRVIKKAADTNVFISAQVQKVMSTLCIEASSHKILQKIGQFKDFKSIPIKQTCVNCLLSMRNQSKIRAKQFIKLTQAFSYFLFDGNQDIRNKAKTGVVLLCNDLGDWYRALRGKINPSYFKSICQIMTKSPIIQKQNPQRYSTIADSPTKKINLIKQDYSTIKNQKSYPQTPMKLQKSQPPKKRILKISNFPSQFQSIQTNLQQCNSSDWKKRLQSLSKIKQLALEFQNQFTQYKSANHFIDVICKQIGESNIKVSLNAMKILEQILEPLRTLIENNLSLICNSVFNTLSSNKPQIKQKGQQLTNFLLDQIQIQLILQFFTHGCLYSLPKSRVYLIQRLKQKVQDIFQKKKQLLYKYIFPLMNKLMDEYKSEIVPGMIGVFNKLFDLMGNQMYTHLTKFKQVKELINR